MFGNCATSNQPAVPMAERRDKGVVKKQFRDQQDKFEDLENRLSRVEAIGYRRLQVENSPGLDSLRSRVEN